MYYQRIFAQIFEDTVQNVIVCEDYEMANYLSKATYGEKAIAVECNQYKVWAGCKYKEGIFYLEDGETAAEYIPSQEEEMKRMEEENEKKITELQLALTQVFELAASNIK